VPDEWIDRVFAVMALAPQHTFQVLTKRSKRMREYVSSRLAGHITRPISRLTDELKHKWKSSHHIYIDHKYFFSENMLVVDPQYYAGTIRMIDFTNGVIIPNIWLGVSAEDQPRADERRDDLASLAAQGWITFVSYEPALKLVDWTGWDFLKQLISGGESGPNACPSHPDWHRAARDFCAAHGIAYFFKQWGAWVPVVDRERDDPDWRKDYSSRYGERASIRWLNLAGGRGFHGERFHVMGRVGKANAGRLLDGVEHNGMPS